MRITLLIMNVFFLDEILKISMGCELSKFGQTFIEFSFEDFIVESLNVTEFGRSLQSLGNRNHIKFVLTGIHFGDCISVMRLVIEFVAFENIRRMFDAVTILLGHIMNESNIIMNCVFIIESPFRVGKLRMRVLDDLDAVKIPADGPIKLLLGIHVRSLIFEILRLPELGVHLLLLLVICVVIVGT